MSRFVTKASKKIQLNETEYIEVKQSIPFSEMEPLMMMIDKNNDMSSIKIAMPLLRAAIIGWNLKDDAGAEVIFSVDKLNELDTITILEILPLLTDLYLPKKKS